MSRRVLLNLLAIVGLVVSVTMTTRHFRVTSTTLSPRNAYQAVREPIRRESFPDGRLGVRDARGELVEIRHYQRILAASTLSSEIIQALVEPTRVVGYSYYAFEHPHSGWKFNDRPLVDSLSNVEAILALEPDIIFFNAYVEATALARLKERGIAVFDLGPMVGMESFLKQGEEIATILQIESRYEHFRQAYRRRLRTVVCKEPEAPESIAYVGMFGPSIFGGTVGTSYHDVIHSAGLIDAAAEHYSGWPDYSPEDLLELNPDWLLTGTGTASTICNHGTLRNLRACAHGGDHVVELDAGMLGDAGGAAILASAEQLFDAVYGPCDPSPLQDSPYAQPKASH